MIDSNAIGLIFAGITSVLVALGGLLSTRQKKITVDVDDLREQIDECRAHNAATQRQVVVAILHIGSLEVAMASALIVLPERPDELDPLWVAERMDTWRAKRVKV